MKLQVAAIILFSSVKTVVGNTGSSSYPSQTGGGYYNYGQQQQHQQQHDQMQHTQYPQQYSYNQGRQYDYQPSQQQQHHQQQMQPIVRQGHDSNAVPSSDYSKYQNGFYPENAGATEGNQHNDQLNKPDEEQEEGLPPLPEGWAEYIDPNSGRPYYYNASTGETTWDRPTIPPQEEAKEEKEQVNEENLKQEESQVDVNTVEESETPDQMDQNQQQHNYDYSGYREQSIDSSDQRGYKTDHIHSSENENEETGIKEENEPNDYQQYEDHEKYGNKQPQSYGWGMTEQKSSGWGMPSSKETDTEMKDTTKPSIIETSQHDGWGKHTTLEDQETNQVDKSYSEAKPPYQWQQEQPQQQGYGQTAPDAKSQMRSQYPPHDQRHEYQQKQSDQIRGHVQTQNSPPMANQAPQVQPQQYQAYPQQQHGWAKSANEQVNERSYQSPPQQWNQQPKFDQYGRPIDKKPEEYRGIEAEKKEEEESQGIFSSLFGRKKDSEASKVDNPSQPNMTDQRPSGPQASDISARPRPLPGVGQYPPPSGQDQHRMPPSGQDQHRMPPSGQYRPGPGSYGGYPQPPQLQQPGGQLQTYQPPPVDNISSMKNAIGGFFQRAKTSVDQVKNTALQRAQEVTDTVATQGTGILGKARAQVENLQKNFFVGDQSGDFSLSPYGSTPQGQGQQYPPQNYGGYPGYGPPHPRSTPPYPHQGHPPQQYPPQHGGSRGPSTQQRPPMQSQWQGQQHAHQQQYPPHQDIPRGPPPQQRPPLQNQWDGQQVRGNVPPQQAHQQFRNPPGQYPPRGGDNKSDPLGADVAAAIDPWQHPGLSGF